MENETNKKLLEQYEFLLNVKNSSPFIRVNYINDGNPYLYTQIKQLKAKILARMIPHEKIKLEVK